MSYNIELSIHLKYNTNSINNMVNNISNTIECSDYYTYYEYEGKGRNIFRQHLLINIKFSNKEKIHHLLRKIKNIKKLKVESVYKEDITYKLLYASTKYLRLLDKDIAKKYKESKPNKKGLTISQIIEI